MQAVWRRLPIASVAIPLRGLAEASLWATAAALLLAAAFPPHHLAWLAWCGLGPLYLLSQRRLWWPALLAGAYLGGLVFHLVNLSWLRQGYIPLGRFDAERHLQWAVLSAIAALAWPLALGAVRYLGHHTRWPPPWVWGTSWTAAEFIRWHTTALVFQSGFPWSQLGITQVDRRWLTQIADLGGVWGVTFTVVAVQVAAFEALTRLGSRSTARQPWQAVRALLPGVSLLLLVTGYGAWRTAQPLFSSSIYVWLMPAWGELDPRVALPAMTPLDPSDGQHILLWSENGFGQRFTAAPEQPLGRRQDALVGLARDAQATLVLGCERVDLPENGVGCYNYNSVAVVDPVVGFLGWYDKNHLVPYGEFEPWANPTLRDDGYRHGTAAAAFRIRARPTDAGLVIAPRICFDSCFPAVHRRAFTEQPRSLWPELFLVSSSESLDATGALPQLMLAACRFRAIECRRPLVRNVCGGISAAIDSRGDVTLAFASSDVRRPERLGPIPLDSRRTLYVRWGDWLPVGCLLMVALPVASRAVRGLAVGRSSRAWQPGVARRP